MKKAFILGSAASRVAGLLLLAQTASAGVIATGGSMTTNGGYIFHAFTNPATAWDQWNTTLVTTLGIVQGGNVEVLVVGGGGGGGEIGGAGGAGGLIYSNPYAVVAGTPVNVTVGKAGAGQAGDRTYGFVGSDSVFGSLAAKGGGYGGGGWKYAYAYAGGPGGSGGGAATAANAGTGTIGPPRQGYDGGLGTGNTAGGGGGGAGSPGISSASNVGGDGGTGRYFAVFSAFGSPTGWFAGGGGGGTLGAKKGIGGPGGGGHGGYNGASALNATYNTGGGGGGGGWSTTGAGGNGAAGIIIVRYRAAPIITNQPSTNVTASDAWLNGYLSDTGAAPVTVSVYWGDTDGGDPTSGLWKATNTWSQSDWLEGSYPTYKATGLVENKIYYYRYYATNSCGPAWPPSSAFFPAVDASYSLYIEGVPSRRDTPSIEGIPTIAYGSNTIIAGLLLTNSVTSPFADAADQALRQKWVCTGWDVTNVLGSVSNGVSAPAVFQLTTNMFLTWYWTNLYDLTTAVVSASGTVSPGGWYTNGTVAEIIATPAGGYGFYRWWGDVPEGSETNNPLFVTMDRARTLTAQWSGETRRWNGYGGWHAAISNWNPIHPPGPGDDAIIESGTAIVDTSSTMRTLTMANSTALVFTNWNTQITASNVTIGAGAIVTAGEAFAALGNRVNFVCTNFVLDAGGQINVNALGYARNWGNPGDGNGPGKGGRNLGDGTGNGTVTWYGGGGGYGGSGGAGNRLPYCYGGATYGTAKNAADDAGSSGGGGFRVGLAGAGGGAVRIVAAGKVTLNGTIVANGENCQDGAQTHTHTGGGGAGGGIAITCASIDGSSTGTVQAKGGDGGWDVPYQGGGGGGGRIAIQYDPQAQAVQGKPQITLSVKPGGNTYAGGVPQPGYGTIYLADEQFLSSDILTDATSMVYGVTNWMPVSLHLSAPRTWVFCEPSMLMCVTGNMTLDSGAGLVLPLRNSRLDCGGDLALTDGGRLAILSGPTNASTADYGALVSVTGSVSVGANSWIYPVSDITNGGSPLFMMQDLTLSGGANGGFDASGMGFAGGYGPGTGTVSGIYGGGGGYGGAGGTADTGPTGGPLYGLTNSPYHPGSGAGHLGGGAGGGYIRIEAKGTVAANGVLRANGAAGTVNGNGAGSGGGIFVMAAKFSGDASGVLEAIGGDGNTLGGGGGGGRIAIWYEVSESRKPGVLLGTVAVAAADTYAGYGGAVSVVNGAGYVNPPTEGAAQPGSIVFLTAFEGTLIELR